MLKILDFTGFSCCVYINFLSANGTIEVPPTTILTYGGENPADGRVYGTHPPADWFFSCSDPYFRYLRHWTSLKIIPKLWMPWFVNSRPFTKTHRRLIPTRWLMDSCLHKLLPLLTQSSSTSMDISAMPINSQSSQMGLASSDISLFWMMILKQLILKCLLKRNLTPLILINPLAIPLP